VAAPSSTGLSSLSIFMMGTQSHYPVTVFPPSFVEPLLSISFCSDYPFSLPHDPSSVATSHVRKIAQVRRKKGNNVHGQESSYRQATTISMLPDNVLLGIFDFYRNHHDYTRRAVCLLVHVCRRWRQIVFASPHRLDLRIVCKSRTPVRKNLGIWPALPILIDYHY